MQPRPHTCMCLSELSGKTTHNVSGFNKLGFYSSLKPLRREVVLYINISTPWVSHNLALGAPSGPAHPENRTTHTPKSYTITWILWLKVNMPSFPFPSYFNTKGNLINSNVGGTCCRLPVTFANQTQQAS